MVTSSPDWLSIERVLEEKIARARWELEGVKKDHREMVDRTTMVSAGKYGAVQQEQARRKMGVLKAMMVVVEKKAELRGLVAERGYLESEMVPTDAEEND